MRVLLDACFPERLKGELVGHEARTAPGMGWASKRNGELLVPAVGRCDVFLTADRNLSYQEDVAAFDITVVVLVARSNGSEDLRLLAPPILAALPIASRPAVIKVGQ